MKDKIIMKVIIFITIIAFVYSCYNYFKLEDYKVIGKEEINNVEYIIILESVKDKNIIKLTVDYNTYCKVKVGNVYKEII